MLNKQEIQKLLEENPEYKEKLFIRGFYFTNDEVKPQEYPFYGNWSHEAILGYNLLVHKLQTYYIHKFNNNKSAMILIGHAYNPFTMQYKETEILQDLANLYNTENFWNKFNELTGIFTLIIIENDNLMIVGDPTCMQCNFYGHINNHFYVSSHTYLLQILLNLKWDPYIKELINYKFFLLLGNYLPGDLSPYKEIKRLVPNHYLKIVADKVHIKRFYFPSTKKINFETITNQASEILQNNLKLISKKWEKPAISLTGGCDSKTTLACANKLYDKFKFFSYISNEAEQIDAEAAHEICENLKLNHTIYKIPNNNSEISDFDITNQILFINSGCILKSNMNDVRKRSYLNQIKDFDVEVKSWVSEIPRAYYSKRFNEKKNFGEKPTPRKCTTLYKFYLHNRKLVKNTDKVFEYYLEKFFERSKRKTIEWQEQFFWEFRVASWNSRVITCEHKYSSDITIPYNNRALLELMLNVNIDDRINDSLYKRIRFIMNPKIDKTRINVTNLKHTKCRAILERFYYTTHSNWPF